MDHNEEILDQFTRQAVPFSASPQVQNEDALERIVQMANAGPNDMVLDVACGPGLLVCAFAKVVRHATGIDLTPKMLQQAKKLQASAGLKNVTWQEGDVQSLPYADGAFSIVSSRFAFHHFLNPLAVLREMRRVCRRGGTIVVADSSPSAKNEACFNQMERLRDPSHVRALPPEELLGLFRAAGLPQPRAMQDLLPYELESFLARSFPQEGDADRIRQLFSESLENDCLGVSARRCDGQVRFSMPTTIVVSSAP